MPKTAAILPLLPLEEMIHSIRGCRVMLDADLAKIYGVTTVRLNEQFRRNQERFPEDFAFQLTRGEWDNLRSQFAISKARGGRRYLPWAFSEHGVLMLANVLKSKVALEASIRVVRVFMLMREQLAAHKELAHKLGELEARVSSHDDAIEKLFEAIRQLIEPPLPENRREIGFHMRETAPPYRVKPRCRT